MATNHNTWIMLAIALGITTQAHADSPVFRQTIGSTVFVQATKGRSISLSTGVLVDARNHLVLTSYHGIADASRVTIMFAIGDSHGNIERDPRVYSHFAKGLARLHGIQEGRVLTTWPEKDLALVKVPSLPRWCHAIRLSESEPSTGQKVHIIGCSRLWRQLSGVVKESAFEYDTIYPKSHQHVHTLAIDAIANARHGDSGGPVVDASGRLVGIVSGGGDRSDGSKRGVFVHIREIHSLLRWYYTRHV